MVAEALRIQGRVLLALMLRDAVTRYGRRKLGYVWALIEPILHIVAFTIFFTFVGRKPALGDSLAVFMATGMASYHTFSKVLTRTMRAYKSGEILLSFPTVKVHDIFLARALLQLATGITVSFIILGALILIGWGPLPRNILMMFAAVFCLFCIGFGAGLILGVLSQFAPSIAGMLRIPLRLLYFTSGLFFLPDLLFPALREILSWNPILHGVTLFRMGYFEHYDSFTLDGEYLMGWVIGSLFFGFLATRVARKPLRNMES